MSVQRSAESIPLKATIPVYGSNWLNSVAFHLFISKSDPDFLEKLFGVFCLKDTYPSETVDICKLEKRQQGAPLRR